MHRTTTNTLSKALATVLTAGTLALVALAPAHADEARAPEANRIDARVETNLERTAREKRDFPFVYDFDGDASDARAPLDRRTVRPPVITGQFGAL